MKTYFVERINNGCQSKKKQEILDTLTQYEAEDILIKSGASNILEEKYINEYTEAYMKEYFDNLLEEAINNYEVEHTIYNESMGVR